MTLGSKLRFLRDRTNKNREEIAKALNIKYSTYANYENDIRQPDLETIKIIAAYFNTSTDYLLGLADYPNKAPYQSPQIISELREGKIAYSDLSEEQKIRLNRMNDLPPELQEHLLGLADTLFKMANDEKNKKD